MKLFSSAPTRRLNVGIHTYFIAALLVVFAGVLIAFLVATARSAENDQQVESIVNSQSAAIENVIQQRLRNYEEILIAGAKMFKITGNLTRQQWSDFAQSLKVQERYPGTRGVGFVKYLQPSEVAPYLASVRAEGFEKFDVMPGGERSEYTVINYVEPLTTETSKAMGYDMFTDPVRRAAMAHARDTAGVALSGPVQLVTDGQGAQPGVLMYMPVYTHGTAPTTPEERRAALYGYTFMAIRMNELIGGSLPDAATSQHIGFRLSDMLPSGEVQKLYDSPHFDHIVTSAGSQQKTATLSTINRQWRLQLAVMDTLPQASSALSPWSIFWTGTLFSILVGAFLFTLMVNRLNHVAFIHEKEVQRTKDELLALASHQLRTPASGVKQYVGMVLQGYAGDVSREQTAMLQKAYDANDRQLEIINQLLYVAKADAGQLAVSKEPFNLTAMLKDVIDGHRSQFKEKRLQLRTRRLPKVAVTSDERYVRMIIENLISNAIKYTPSGGIITISLAKEADHALCSVSDTGVGIARDDQEKLFQKFSRIQNSLSRQAGGSGIGLYLSRQLAERLSGELTYESGARQGSVFTLKLPYKPTCPEQDYRSLLGTPYYTKRRKEK